MQRSRTDLVTFNENLENFPFETRLILKQKKKKKTRKDQSLARNVVITRENCRDLDAHFDSIALGEAQGARVCKDTEDTSRIRVVGIAG